jgi:hypothetical protein
VLHRLAEAGRAAPFSIQLLAGNYSALSLITAIDAAFAAPGGLWSNTYICTIDSITSKVSIRAIGVAFSLLFASGINSTNSLAKVLGFGRQDTASAISQTGTRHASLILSLFVDVVLEGIPNNAMKQVIGRDAVSGDATTRNIIARVPLDVNLNQLKFYYADRCELLHNYFPPMKLDRLAVRLFNDSGREYLTDGVDFYVMFEVVQLVHDWEDEARRERYSKCLPPVRKELKSETDEHVRSTYWNDIGKKAGVVAAIVGVGAAGYFYLNNDDV